MARDLLVQGKSAVARDPLVPVVARDPLVPVVAGDLLAPLGFKGKPTRSESTQLPPYGSPLYTHRTLPQRMY